MENNYQLRKLQNSLVEILKEIDSVCKKNNIPYFLVGGTLLGAKRHGGFIPWDDDLDIAMTREDYIRFEQAVCTDLREEFYLRNFHTDPGYYLPFGKVCKKGTLYVTDIDSEQTMENEIFVDIFPLDAAKEEMCWKQKVQALSVKGLKAVIIRKKGLKLKKTSFPVKVMQILLTPFSIETLMQWQEKIMQMCQDNAAQYLVNLGSNYSYVKQTMKRDIYFPVGKITFEGISFQAPANIEYYLRRIYGEGYMELPPVEKRVTHNIIKLELGDKYE